MYKLVLLRHGESQWNLENRFTGWTDVDLTKNGCKEARAAGELLRDEGYDFDIAYTSVLRRAIRTLWITLDVMDRMWLPVVHSWRLNERHYGALQGLNKAETAARFGEQQVHLWRRAYAVAPDPLSPDDPRSAGREPRYRHLAPSDVPATECSARHGRTRAAVLEGFDCALRSSAVVESSSRHTATRCAR